MNKLVNIYTDGACQGNQNDENLGGYGCILEYQGVEKELHGGEINTTNNRMEMLALICALEMLKEKNLTLHIFSDSSYLVNCFKEKWYETWKKNGWKNSKKSEVENKDLWEKLLSLLESNNASFFLVKGHVKTPTKELYKKFTEHNGDNFSFSDFEKIISYNQRCDALAGIFPNEQKKDNT